MTATTAELTPTSTRMPTLADLAIGSRGRATDAVLIATAAVATAVAAQIAIPLPFTPVPLSGQTFAVLLGGVALGARRGFLTQLLYLFAGLAGAPVFANGGLGPATLLGPTGGYLLGFPVAAFIAGTLAERGWDRRFLTSVAAMLVGSSAIFACGLLGLSSFVPADALLATGLLPFLPGDVIKATAAALALPQVWRQLGRR